MGIIEIFIMRKNKFHVLILLNLEKMIIVGNFAKMASLCGGFYLVTLHGYFFF